MGENDSSSQPITSQEGGNSPEYKREPVFATCSECGTSAMTVVVDNECGCGCSCILSCLFSVICGLCFAVLTQSNPSQLPACDPALLTTTYIHKCSSCYKEMGRFRNTT